jgi:hypothetical protein
MGTRVKTVVTFKSTAFNLAEPKAYFINPCCFGDDVAKWFIQELRVRGYQAADEPGQEDFGWYFTFVVMETEYCFVIGHRPGDKKAEGIWIGWLERSQGFIASVLGGRKRAIQPAAAQVIHEILSNSPLIRDICWHFRRDFDNGRERIGPPSPVC